MWSDRLNVSDDLSQTCHCAKRSVPAMSAKSNKRPLILPIKDNRYHKDNVFSKEPKNLSVDLNYLVNVKSTVIVLWPSQNISTLISWLNFWKLNSCIKYPFQDKHEVERWFWLMDVIADQNYKFLRKVHFLLKPIIKNFSDRLVYSLLLKVLLNAMQ